MQQQSAPSFLCHSALAVAIAVAGCLCAVPSVLAQPARSEIHIQAQDLGAALDSLASQTGIRLLYSPEAVKDKRAAAVDGMFGADEALRRLLAGSGLSWSVSGGAYAIKPTVSGAPSSAKELALVTVTATRTERSVEDVPASVSVIAQRDIATQQPTTVKDLLRNVEGIDLQTSPSLGESEAVTIRGVGGSFGGSSSPILLDGMALESPVTGIHIGMKALALHDVERIEVVRGPVSALYGPSAVGGVVNLIPKRWRGAPGGEVEIGIGSHDSTQVTAAVGGAWDVVDFRFSGSDYRTDGYVAQPDPDNWGGKDLGPRDGKERKFGVTAGLRPSDNQEITLAIRNADIKSAWLGGHPDYRINAKVESYDLGYRYEVGGWAVFKVRYRSLRQKAHLLFDADAWGTTGDLSLAEVDNRTDTSNVIDLQADLRLARNNVLTLGYNYSLGKYATTSEYVGVLLDNPAERTVSKSKLTGVVVQDEHRFSNALTVLVGGRWDRYKLYGDSYNGVPTGEDSTDNVFNPRLGVRYHINAAASFYASAGTAYVPAMNYLKFRSSVDWIDNPGLQPETSTSYEVGANYRQGSMAAHAAIYHTDYEDKIERITIGEFYQFANVAKVTVDGLELAAEIDLAGGWHPYANYAYTNSRVRKNPSDPALEGKQLQDVAPHKLNLGVIYAPSKDYYVRFSGRYKSAYYFDEQNTPAARDESNFVADVKFGWRLPAGGFARKLELTLAVNNLFDKRYREQQYVYQDGRNVWLGLNARF